MEWLRAQEPEIAVDPIILGELRFGILILLKGKKRTSLEHWFDEWGTTPLPGLERRDGPPMGGAAGPASDNRESDADQGQADRGHGVAAQFD
jgi:hypothetical protein